MIENVSQTMRLCALLGGIAIFVSLLLTRLMLWLLPKWGMLDRPDFARHIHTRAVPRGGGLGMMLAFAGVAATYFGLMQRVDADAPAEMLKLLAPLGVLLPVGVLDDRIGLRARTKFLCQILAATIAWHYGFRMSGCFGISFPPWLGFILTVLWIVALINAFNMIDGVDGLAAGVGLISATCMGVIALFNHHYPLTILLTVFGGSLLGFLYFNWHPARLFMGDTGSMFIGYVLAIAGLYLNAQTISVASIGIPLLACGIPVLDIALAIWRRIIGTPTPTPEALDAPVDERDAPAANSLPLRLARLAARLGTADQSHLHHRLLRHFRNNQRKTVLRIYLLALVLGAMGIVCFFLPNGSLLLSLVIIIGTFSFILNRLAFIELWNSTEVLYHNFQSAHTGILISYVINPLWDLCCIVCAFFIATRGYPIGVGALLRYTAILMVILCCSRSYRVLWNFAASDDYFRLGCTLIFGFLVARGSDFFFRFDHINRLHSYAAGIAVSLILLERLFLHYFRNAQIRRHATVALADGAKPVLTAIVGVSPMARLYRNLLAADLERAAQEEIVGIVSLDRHFVHSYCFGMKVLGHFDSLKDIIADKHIGKIVVAKAMDSASLGRLQAICAELNLPFSRFDCHETPLN